MNGCIAAGADYMDITGEIEVIELGHSLDARAKEAGVAVIPAVGFDVVPSDCLAAMLADRLPNARVLQLAFTAMGGLSPGTTKTMLEAMPAGGRRGSTARFAPCPPLGRRWRCRFASGGKCA